MAMNLVQRTFKEFSDVEVSYFVRSPEGGGSKPRDDVLVVSFASKRATNWRDLSFMRAMQLAGFEVWRASAMVLDLRELHYRWGDTMSELFRSPRRHSGTPLEKIFGEDRRFPIVAVVSPLNRDGLTSLFRDEMSMDPSDVLFESLDEAVAAVEAYLRRLDADGSEVG